MNKESKRNILYISYDGMTDNLGQSQVIPYLIGLSKKNYNITLLSCEKKEKLQLFCNDIHSILQKNGITWKYIFYNNKLPVLSAFITYLLLNRKALQICAGQKIHIVHCRSYLTAMIGLSLKTKHGSKLLFDMRGFWADERLDGNIWNKNNILYKLIYQFFKSKEKQLLENADYTVSLTQKAKDEILKWQLNNINENNIEVIPCCADYDLFVDKNISLINRDEFKKIHSLNENDFILLYLGSIGTWYMLTEMLLFFKQLKKRKTNAKFLFLTPDKPEFIFQQGKLLKIESKEIIVHSANRKELPALISIANVSIFFIRPSYSKIASSPTKMAEILAMEIPVICNKGVGDTDVLVSNNKFGYVVDTFDEDGYENVLNELEHFNPIKKKYLREKSKEIFSLENGIKKYDNIYQSLLRNKD